MDQTCTANAHTPLFACLLASFLPSFLPSGNPSASWEQLQIFDTLAAVASRVVLGEFYHLERQVVKFLLLLFSPLGSCYGTLFTYLKESCNGKIGEC